MVLKDFFSVIFICENFLLFLCKTFGLWPKWLGGCKVQVAGCGCGLQVAGCRSRISLLGHF